MRAPRYDPIGRWHEHLDEPGLVEVPPALEHAKAHPLPRQCSVDEDGLAVDPGNTAAVVGEIDHVGLFEVARLQGPGHAAANSWKCAAEESRSNCRTRAISWACSRAFKRPRNSS